jgi:signal transduction histidine kinase
MITHADAGMIDQILLNLAVNARDAMPRGGSLLIETFGKNVDKNFTGLNPDAKPGRYVCLSVSDTGTGIPPGDLPRIFEPFFTTKDIGKGTGLGLATVFGIVKQHRGTALLLLTDLVMPSGVSGQELADQLRHDTPQLKVIFMSGYSAEIAGRQMELKPGENFLQKPFPPDQLLETVRRCLDDCKPS